MSQYHDPEQYRPSSKPKPSVIDSLFDSVERAEQKADICRNKHQGAETSEAANEKVHPVKTELRAQVYAVILRKGSAGATLKEIEAELSMLRNTVSARLSELLQSGMIESSGLRRDGCRVMVPRFAEVD